MTSQSISTQLQVINEAVRNVGDRPFELDDPDTNFRHKCRFAVKTALFNFERDFDWLFARRYTVAQSWNGKEAKIPEYTRLSYVDYRGPTGNYRLTELYLDEFRQFIDTPFTINNSYPLYYAQQDAESVLVLPEPEDAIDRSRIFFSYYAALKRPADDEDNFDIPETHIPLLVLKLSVELALVHLNDEESIRSLRSQYEESKRLAISRNQGISIRKANMFRGNRNARRH